MGLDFGCNDVWQRVGSYSNVHLLRLGWLDGAVGYIQWAIAKASEVRGKCAFCGASGAPMKCSRCKVAWYCDTDCQRASWLAGHKHDCKRDAPLMRYALTDAGRNVLLERVLPWLEQCGGMRAGADGHAVAHLGFRFPPIEPNDRRLSKKTVLDSLNYEVLCKNTECHEIMRRVGLQGIQLFVNHSDCEGSFSSPTSKSIIEALDRIAPFLIGRIDKWFNWPGNKYFWCAPGAPPLSTEPRMFSLPQRCKYATLLACSRRGGDRLPVGVYRIVFEFAAIVMPPLPHRAAHNYLFPVLNASAQSGKPLQFC